MRTARALSAAAVAGLLLASPVAAQMDHDDASVEGVRNLYTTVKGFLVASAEQASADLYAYRPTEEVRSFGEILGHVANAGYLFCGAAAGMERPQLPNAEEFTAKADIVAAVKAMFEFCDRAHQIDGTRAAEAITFFNQDHTRLSVLAFNMGHNFEHYGNLVTYMRINGMVPPSSQGG
ncbi:MAG: DinB family protein [Longimicrobiales bacterium]